MAGEFSRGLRLAETGKISRRGHHRHAAGPELARDEARSPQRPDANRHVGTLLHQVDDRISENDVERDIRMLGEEARQQRHHVLHAEGYVAIHHQMPARRCTGAGLALRLLDFAEDAQRALIEGLAFLGQLKLARGPVHKSRAEPGLQAGYQLAHAGWGHAKAFCRRGEPAEVDDPDEDLHLGGTIGIEPAHVEFVSQMIGLPAS